MQPPAAQWNREKYAARGEIPKRPRQAAPPHRPQQYAAPNYLAAHFPAPRYPAALYLAQQQQTQQQQQAQRPQERPTPPTTGQFVKIFVIVANLPYRECRISKASLPPLLSETPQNKNIIL